MLLKVVIVEDEEIIRKGLTFALNWLDMGCIIAVSYTHLTLPTIA